jgi:hypothetical protein
MPRFIASEVGAALLAVAVALLVGCGGGGGGGGGGGVPGPPFVVLAQCAPTEGAVAVGTASAVTIGSIDLPTIRVHVSEALDPSTVSAFTGPGPGANVQLWRVGEVDRTPLVFGPEPVDTAVPAFVSATNEIQLIANGPVLQGTYVVNLVPAITDPSPEALRISDSPDPVPDGFGAIDASLSGVVASGYRIYFVTNVVGATPSAFAESFASSAREWGDSQSGGAETGVFTKSVVATNPIDFILGGTIPTEPSLTLSNTITGAGQSTTANWNGDFHFLNLSTLVANPDVDNGTGRLKAVWRPHGGSGADGVFDTTLPPFSSGPDTITLSTNPGAGASVNGDGIYEYDSFRLGVGDTLIVTGSNPLIILCRGDFTVAGRIVLSGGDGGAGLDTDGTSFYTNGGAIHAAGAGGAAGPGGGAGGAGGDPFKALSSGGTGADGGLPMRLEVNASTPQNFALAGGVAPGALGSFADGTNKGGGGGGFGSAGSPGADAAGATIANAGPTHSSTTFVRNLSEFLPDRGQHPTSDIRGGTGGGGGGVDDDNGASEAGNATLENGDDGGGGGGGGGGAILAFVCGNLSVAATGSIEADGGKGGSTFSRANQLVGLGPDGIAATSDDFVAGLTPSAVASGQGAPGGGGSGGAIIFFAEGTVNLVGSLFARGGIGGKSGDPDRVGGSGGGGRVAIGLSSALTGGGSITAGSSVTFSWNPTVTTTSCGQSEWLDLGVATGQFGSIDLDGAGPNPPVSSPPRFTTNFATLTAAGLTQGTDWDAVLEFQGAATLTPAPGGASPPTSATGLTQWSTSPDSVDLKRFVRYRWRFFVAKTFPGWQRPSDPPGTAKPMPAILDVTIPYAR